MGDIQIFHHVHSHAEGFDRTVRVFTPTRYEASPHERFGVLYMQDGQNVFEHPLSARHPTWAANNALEALVRPGRLGPSIIVAVDHGLGRFEDYSPWDEPRAQVKARGETYARFLIDELKPLVDRTFRTRPEPEWTAVCGSSLGGLISLYLHWRHGHVFPRVGALSPSVMWSDRAFFRHWNATPAQALAHLHRRRGRRGLRQRPLPHALRRRGCGVLPAVTGTWLRRLGAAVRARAGRPAHRRRLAKAPARGPALAPRLLNPFPTLW